MYFDLLREEMTMTTQDSMNFLLSTTLTSNKNTNNNILCRFGENCANVNCIFAHLSPATFGITGSSINKYNIAVIDSPCKFGSYCTNPKCRYSHPSPASCKLPIPCRNGNNCVRPGCYFLHSWDMETDIPVSNRVSYGHCMYDHPMGKKELLTYISERAFALPGQMTEDLPNSSNNDTDSVIINNNQRESKGDETGYQQEHYNTLQSRMNECNANEEEYVLDLDFDE
ncbi:16967_t:CDS:2 [Entrophospora sp. SA101]|nr:9031_t:CDS:2 [Entrophospora sp. SA101]CAJ0827029.1 3528_t:CDS:2 [Entrophospora sp. SA101]CAJ0909389.1 16967_t:CDS:2 [Entrophospora sp. SA101]